MTGSAVEDASSRGCLVYLVPWVYSVPWLAIWQCSDYLSTCREVEVARYTGICVVCMHLEPVEIIAH